MSDGEQRPVTEESRTPPQNIIEGERFTLRRRTARRRNPLLFGKWLLVVGFIVLYIDSLLFVLLAPLLFSYWFFCERGQGLERNLENEAPRALKSREHRYSPTRKALSNQRWDRTWSFTCHLACFLFGLMTTVLGMSIVKNWHPIIICLVYVPLLSFPVAFPIVFGRIFYKKGAERAMFWTLNLFFVFSFLAAIYLYLNFEVIGADTATLSGSL